MSTNHDERKAFWSLPKGEAHTAAYAAGIRCITRGSRRTRYRAMRTLANGGGWDAPSEHKVIDSAINTVVAKISKSEVMPVARAVGIRRSRQERAKRLSHWIRGQVMALGVHKLARKALRDSATYGSGALHVFRGLDDRPAVERVWVGDLGVEENEEEYGDVRTLFRAMTIDRAVAIEKWGSKAKDLRSANYAFGSENRSRVITGAPITVLECWRLTTGGLVGRHVICTSSCTLVDEEWDSHAFPVLFHHWVEDCDRFFGRGLAEAMAGEQRLLDRITDKIEDSFDQSATHILIDVNSEVTVEQLDNVPFSIIKYSSTGAAPPQWVSPPAVSSDHRMHQETLIDRCYSMHGVSQLSAQSRKPPGLNAAVALETFNDIESERFWIQTKDFEQLVVQVGERLIEVAEEIADDDALTDKSKADCLVSTKAEVRMVRFNDARLPTDQRSLEVEPLSMFSATLSGRVQAVDTLRQTGAPITGDQWLELVDDPNLNKFRSLEAGGRHVVEIQVERCLSGRRQTPDGSLPLDFALRHATEALHVAILEQGDDEEDEDDELEQGMALLRDYIADVQTLQDQAAAKAAPPMPAGAPPMPMPEQAMAPPMG